MGLGYGFKGGRRGVEMGMSPGHGQQHSNRGEEKRGRAYAREGDRVCCGGAIAACSGEVESLYELSGAPIG